MVFCAFCGQSGQTSRCRILQMARVVNWVCVITDFERECYQGHEVIPIYQVCGCILALLVVEESPSVFVFIRGSSLFESSAGFSSNDPHRKAEPAMPRGVARRPG